MKMAFRYVSAIVIGSVFFLAACAGTKFLSVWKDSAYSGGILQKILIVGVSDKLSNRRIFEDELAGQLKSHGTEAISSATVIPTMKEIDETVIKEAALKLKADAVLITHLEGVSEKTVYHPPVYDYSANPGYNRFGYYYRSVHQHVYTPGYVATYQYVRLENKLYETATEKLLWAATSETFDPDSVNAVVESLSKIVIKSLKESGLIR
jgi:hypothetical protein